MFAATIDVFARLTGRLISHRSSASRAEPSQAEPSRAKRQPSHRAQALTAESITALANLNRPPDLARSQCPRMEENIEALNSLVIKQIQNAHLMKWHCRNEKKYESSPRTNQQSTCDSIFLRFILYRFILRYCPRQESDDETL